LPRKYTLEEIKAKAKEKGYEILSKRYFSSNSKLKFKHILCRYEFIKSWGDFFDSGNCKKCAGLFVELSDCSKLAEENNFTILSKRYISCDKKLKIKHNCCGHVFKISWDNFKQKRSCPQCSKKVRITIKKVKDLSKQNGYKLISKKYINSKTKMEFIHLDCGRKYFASWDTFKKGVGCGFCFGNNKPSFEFVKSFSEIKGFTLVTKEYRNRKSKLRFIHNHCGFMFETSWSSFYGNNSGCPKCLEPRGELEVEKWLSSEGLLPEKDYFPQYFFEDCKNERYLYFDFYIPSENLCIEYNGKQHYEPVEFFGGKKEFDKNKQRDLIKEKYCETNKIKLLIIPYWNKEKIQEILKNRNKFVSLCP
jgi:hypothetical protein